jgi:hypothetical protein
MSDGREDKTFVPGAIFFNWDTWNTGCTEEDTGSARIKPLYLEPFSSTGTHGTLDAPKRILEVQSCKPLTQLWQAPHMGQRT